MRCAREFVVSVVSFTEISRDLCMKRDVRESSWCLWCLLDHFFCREFSRISRFMFKSREITVKDTTDTTNSLAHLVSCQNLMRFHPKTPHFGVHKFSSRECSVHKPELSRNLVLCHVTYISTNQNALNFKISREIMRFQAIFFPFKEQSCYTALLKTVITSLLNPLLLKTIY